MILLDTSLLIEAWSSRRAALPDVRRAIVQGEQFLLSSVVLYEWLRGPRTSSEILEQEQILPSADAIPFGPTEASLAADIYRAVKRARSREIDIAIAATAIRHNAKLWTLNPADFADIPGLTLYKPR
ncbi:MAG: type II toxin-antitoxin system VapC family toxin [Bryobacteraceae bacterium]